MLISQKSCPVQETPMGKTPVAETRIADGSVSEVPMGEVPVVCTVTHIIIDCTMMGFVDSVGATTLRQVRLIHYCFMLFGPDKGI